MKNLIFRFFILLILVISVASADGKDIAYVVRNNINQDFINVINNLGLSYDVINNNDASITNFSKYKMILVGDEFFSNTNEIPVNDFNSLIVNTYHIEDWGLSKKNPSKTAASQPLSIRNRDLNKYVVQGLNEYVDVYTSCCSGNGLNLPLYFLSRLDRFLSLYVVSSTISNNLDGVITISLPGTRLFNNDVTKGRTLFFGITETRYWTNDAKELFKRSLIFTINGNDKDNDGFSGVIVGGLDCDDNDRNINPNATEVAYDNIDQNCANDRPLLINSLLSIISNEDVIRNNIFNLNDYFNDPDGDLLRFSFTGNSNINITINNGNVSFVPKKDFFGRETVIFTASDGNLSSNSNNIILDIKNVNDMPVLINNIPDLEFDEDTTFNLNLNDYFNDPDGDLLRFSFTGNSNINITINNGNVSFVPKKDFFGRETVIFTASDGNLSSNSNNIILDIKNVNDMPVLINNIPDLEFDEDTTFNLNLNDYFNDPDGGLSFSYSDNVNIDILINNGTAKLMPFNNFFGEDSIVFYAFDETTLLESNKINLTIKSVNDKPIISSVNILDNETWEITNNIYEDNNYIISASVLDIENDELMYEWYLDNNLISNDKEFFYNFGFNLQGNRTLKLIVKDSGSSFKERYIFVNNINRKPKILMNNNFNLKEDETIFIDLNAVDEDNDNLIFSSENGNKIICNIINNKLEVKSLLNFFGEDMCILSVTDGIDNDIIEINFNVEAVNDVPAISKYEPIDNNIKIVLNDRLEFSVEYSDIENNELMYEWYLDNNLISNDKNFSYEFITLGTTNIKVIVTDGTNFQEQNWVVNVVDRVNKNNFDGETTDFFNVDLNNINKLILEKSNVGKILFLENISLGSNKDLDSNVIISKNIVSVNSLLIPGLNKKARITMLHQNYNNVPLILKSDKFTDNIALINEPCNDCKLISFTNWPTNDGTVIFDVDKFSSYAIKQTNSNINNNSTSFCKSGNKGNIKLEVIEPDNNDKIDIEKDLLVRLRVKNNDNAVAGFSLKDNNGNVVFEDSDDLNSDEATEFNFDIKDDVNEEEYTLFVKAFENNNEQNNCKEKSIDIKFIEKENNVRVNKFLVEPNVLACNSMVNVNVELENLGKEEDVIVKLYNKELNMELSDNINLGKINNNNKKNIFFSFLVPNILDKEKYNLNLDVLYSDELKITKDVSANKCKEGFIDNIESNLFLLQDSIGVNKDNSFVVPIQIVNNDNTEKRYVVEINDAALENSFQYVNLNGFEKKVVYLQSNIKQGVKGVYSGAVNLKENNRIIESKIVKLNNLNEEKKNKINTGFIFILFGSLVFLFLVILLIILFFIL